MLLFAKITGHFVPKSFRTQVIKYLFGHFVPTNYPFHTHVTSLPLWSVNSNLVIKCQKWLRNDDCVGLQHSSHVIPFWSFRTFILLILYPFIFDGLVDNSMKQNYFTMICFVAVLPPRQHNLGYFGDGWCL